MQKLRKDFKSLNTVNSFYKNSIYILKLLDSYIF